MFPANRRFISLLLVLLALAALLSACGSGESSSAIAEAKPSAAPDTPRPTDTAAPTDTPVPTDTPTPEPTDTPEPAATPTPVFDCPDPLGCVDIAPGEPIHIGYMLTTSGATGFLGDDSLGAIEIALDDRGQLLGHDLLLTGEDSLCSSAGGRAAARAIVADPTLIGAIGTNCSSAAVGALPIISDAGLLMISPSNTAPGLTDPRESWQPGYYRVSHNDVFQGQLAALFAFNELGALTAATVHDGSPYAYLLQQYFVETFVALGGTITEQAVVNVGESDLRPALAPIAETAPDVLYFPIFEPEGPLLVDQAAGLAGLAETVFIAADGLLSSSFPRTAGPAAEGMYITGPYVYGRAYDDFLDKWQAKFGGSPPSGFHAFAYDATNILLEAIEVVAIVTDDGSLHIPRQALRDAVTATAAFPGLTGSLTCSDYGDCSTGKALGIFQITAAEIAGQWPPPVVYTPGDSALPN